MKTNPLQDIADILNGAQKEITFSVKKDKLIYTVDNVTYTCSIDEVIDIFDRTERVKL
mgnify:FL=1|jgi:hypothetical protein